MQPRIQYHQLKLNPEAQNPSVVVTTLGLRRRNFLLLVGAIRKPGKKAMVENPAAKARTRRGR
jgi:hypothetical protein